MKKSLEWFNGSSTVNYWAVEIICNDILVFPKNALPYVREQSKNANSQSWPLKLTGKLIQSMQVASICAAWTVG